MSDHRSRVTTHVLDATTGRPAVGVGVRLEQQALSDWLAVAEDVTDADGRIGAFGPVDLDPGIYRVVFDTAAYFDSVQQQAFYPEVVISFVIVDPGQHYHVPLLLSPYAFSTYRGS